MCIFVLWPLVPVGRSDGNTSAQITLDWSNWLCYAPRTFLCLSGYTSTLAGDSSATSLITSPKLLLYHKRMCHFTDFWILPISCNLLQHGRANFNRNWNVPKSRLKYNSQTNFLTNFLHFPRYWLLMNVCYNEITAFFMRIKKALNNTSQKLIV